MTKGTGGPFDPAQLVRDFVRYDRHVDVVSAYQWLFTDTRDLPSTVAHFERYPKIRGDDGNDATPDFTVLFTDGTGIAAEIATIAQHEGSVDKLCRQLGRYATLPVLPDANGKMTPVSVLDVVYLSPFETAAYAVERIFTERLDNPEHPYKPARRPVVVQFAQEPDKYVFQVYPDQNLNGSLHVGDRTPNYATFKTLKVLASSFAAIKVEHAFMNDPVAPLYLATRLWANVIPSQYGTGQMENDVTAEELAGLLRDQYGHGTGKDVRRAMEILVAAGLAKETVTNQWRVNRRSLRRTDPDVHRAIAARVADDANRPAQTTRRGRRSKAAPGSGQDSLFDL